MGVANPATNVNKQVIVSLYFAGTIKIMMTMNGQYWVIYIPQKIF